MELDGGIKIYLREIGKTDLLTPDQEVELAERIKRGDPEARSHMIRANLRLVVKIAQDYANYGLPLLDLISEGVGRSDLADLAAGDSAGTSSRMMSLHSSMHSSQMNTDGPAISFFTSCCDLPQNEQ